MASNDPFSEPDDTDRTVIRPNPGGRRKPAAPDPVAAPPPPPPPAAAPAPAAGYGIPAAASPAATAPGDGHAALALSYTGMNRLAACATPLLLLVSRIRNRAQHMDPDKLRQSVIAEIRAFESRALQAGTEAQTVKIARYAICATLDDVVLNTPWGEASAWSQQSMVGTFHRETVGGDRFYDLLARLEKDPGSNVEMLEFLYLCLSLGFEGRLRVEAGGGDKHLQIRNGLARIIRAQRGPVEHDLSPHWKGLDRPHKALSAWRPVWISLGAAVALLASGFLGLSWALGGATERVLGQLSSLDSGAAAVLERRAPPPPLPEVTEASAAQLDKMRGFLKQEIADGIVSVTQDANTIKIRITGNGMFASGSDALQPAFTAPLERVATALDGEPGAVIVAGHSDNVPIGHARFPSNMHLSLARAEAVMQILAANIADPGRLKAEGRADKEPIASNDTAEGRAQNRRIEVLLMKAQG